MKWEIIIRGSTKAFLAKTIFRNTAFEQIESGANDAEADFVIAHPDMRILILEVKGCIGFLACVPLYEFSGVTHQKVI